MLRSTTMVHYHRKLRPRAVTKCCSSVHLVLITLDLSWHVLCCHMVQRAEEKTEALARDKVSRHHVTSSMTLSPQIPRNVIELSLAAVASSNDRANQACRRFQLIHLAAASP